MNITLQLMTKRAKLIDDPVERMRLIELEDTSHIPYPLLTRFQKLLVRRLEMIGVRGKTWFFTCPKNPQKKDYYKFHDCATCTCYDPDSVCKDIAELEELDSL